MSDHKYIESCDSFIVNGKTVKASTLTEAEKQALLEQSAKAMILTSDITSDQKPLV